MIQFLTPLANLATSFLDRKLEETKGKAAVAKAESSKIEVEQQRFKDAVWVSVKGSKAKEKILIGCVYRSGTPTTAIANDDNLHTMMRKASELTSYHSL